MSKTTGSADSFVRYLGHAGFVVTYGDVRLLIDPWFFPAFLGAWFPFPDNRHLLPEVTGECFDALYLSHLHQDHFDERLLERLDRDLTVIVPQYRSKSMVRRLRAMGFRNLAALSHREQYVLAEGFTVTMLLDTSHKEDSGLLLDLSGFRFLDLNDCNTQLSELPSNIDLLAAQYSGAMWYPNCYSYPAEVMAQKVASVRESMMETLVRKVQLTGARSYLPSAGPACFLDPALQRFNDRQHTIFPVWDDVSSEFAVACPDTQVVLMAPGDTTGELRQGISPRVVPGGAKPCPADQYEYLTKYRERRRCEWEAYYADPVKPVTADEVEAYFRRLQRWNARFLRDYRKDIRLVADGVHWSVRLGRLAERFVFEEDLVDPDYTLHVPPRVLRAVLDGEAGWEEALLSMRLTLHRTPDVFDLTLMSLLRYGNQPAQTMQLVRERESTETIDRDGLRMQRFCPHAGEDLAYATVRDGVVECPRHHWKWDARTGQCLDGGTVSLRVHELASRDPSPKLPIA
jgi:UDP-MurNAc hydroxylase